MLFLSWDILTVSDSLKITLIATFAAGIAGILAGLIYRAGAVIVLSFFTMVAAVTVSISQGWTIWQGLALTFGLLFVVQIGYLIGVTSGIIASRLRRHGTVRSFIEALFGQNAPR